MKITREIIQDVFTHDLAQRRPNCYQTFNAEQIRRSLVSHKIIRKGHPHDKALPFPSVDFSELAVIPAPSYKLTTGHYAHLFTNDAVLEVVTKRAPQIIQLMKEFPGKVYIAGGMFLSIFLFKDITYEGDIDVFICAGSPEEAEIILSRGVDLVLKGNVDPQMLTPEEKYKVETSPMVTSVISVALMKNSGGARYFTKIQFIRRLYPEGRPDMIIGAFDLHPCQIFWSLETGIQCTAAALVSLITHSFPLDLSRRSLSYGNRLRKYLNKCFTITLPGVNIESPIEKFGYNKAPQGKREIFEIIHQNIKEEEQNNIRITSKNSKNKKHKKPCPPPAVVYDFTGYEDLPRADYEEGAEGDQEGAEGKAEGDQEGAEGKAEGDQEGAEGKAEGDQEGAEGKAEGDQEGAEGTLKEKVNQEYEDDFEGEPQLKRNLSAVMRENMNVSLLLENYSDFCTENFDLKKAVFGKGMSLKSIFLCRPQGARKRFKSQEEYEKFAMALYVRQDKKEASKIWEKNVEDLLAYLRPHFCGGKPPSFYWKLDNPGAQCFGQNYPRPIPPEEYYGGPENYARLRVGLPDFSYWALKILAVTHKIHRDLFRMLCNWGLKAEGHLALQRLKLQGEGNLNPPIDHSEPNKE